MCDRRAITMKKKMPQNKAIINGKHLELVQGDITQEHTDAIVNAANSSLLGGGGVDGAIHRAAGPKLLAETRQLGGCETGDAKISGGYRLHAKHVIHAVGPVYQSNSTHVADALASAYHRSLEIASEHNLRSVAFPAISTGVYGYPMQEAAQVALGAVIDYMKAAESTVERVRFVLFTDDVLQIFANVLQSLLTDSDKAEPA